MLNEYFSDILKISKKLGKNLLLLHKKIISESQKVHLRPPHLTGQKMFIHLKYYLFVNTCHFNHY